MTEELYIIKDGKRSKLDIKTPSGITLSYESNLFNSLDKVNSSRSYTFNLPKTNNNVQIFDIMQDIRSTGTIVGKTYPVEFIVNGVNLCRDAKIYINEVKEEFSAVMTWDIVDGLTTLKNNDVNISELETSAERKSISENHIVTPYWQIKDLYPSSSICPKYVAGVDANWLYAPPVVSVSELLTRINTKFGTKIFQNDEGSLLSNDLITNGCIPDIKCQLSDVQYQKYNSKFTSISQNSNGLLTWTINTNNSGTLYDVTTSSIKTKQMERGGIYSKYIYKFHITGKIAFSHPSGNVPYIMEVFTSNGSEENVLATIEREYDGKNFSNVFNFTKESGTPIEVSITDDSYVGGIYFRMLDGYEDGQVCEGLVIDSSSYIELYPVIEEGGEPHPTDIFYSLPEISCLSLVKSMFYMMGAFPKLGKNGNVVPCYYSDLYNNIEDNNVYDWSKNIVNLPDNPKELCWKVGDFAQKNYYCMKSDKPLETSENDKVEQGYTSGADEIVVNNCLLEKSKIIVQLPFYAPYAKNEKYPLAPTGNTFKYWTYGDKYYKFSASEAKPIFGIVKGKVFQVPDDEGNYDSEDGYVMECWNDFQKRKASNSTTPTSMDCLQNIIATPKVVKIELMLDEYTLSMLEYDKPVYLSQFSSFFAIIKIQRSSNGICEAELIRISMEEYVPETEPVEPDPEEPDEPDVPDPEDPEYTATVTISGNNQIEVTGVTGEYSLYYIDNNNNILDNFDEII